jgi:sec-independent protein translocase protein TatA
MGIDNPVHLIFIAAVALIVLGPKRLPELARSLGHGIREFRESMSEAVKDDGSVTGSLVPDQAQLVASTEPVVAAPVDAVVIDLAAPERAATAVSPDLPAPEAPMPMAAAEVIEQPLPPPAS